jgi:hypothetical protein
MKLKRTYRLDQQTLDDLVLLETLLHKDHTGIIQESVQLYKRSPEVRKAAIEQQRKQAEAVSQLTDLKASKMDKESKIPGSVSSEVNKGLRSRSRPK